MGTEESNKSGRLCQIMVAQEETLNQPVQLHWSTSIQGCHYSWSLPTPFINSYAAGSHFFPYMWPNQASCTPLQHDSLHDPKRHKNETIVAGGSALTVSDKVQRIFSEKNQNSMEKCEGNLHPRRFVIKELREIGNGSSIPKIEQDGTSWSAASGSEGSTDDGLDTNNGFPSSKKQQCEMTLANGEVAQKVATLENCDANHVNKNSSLQQFAVNSTELNLSSGTDLNVSGATPDPAKLEEDERRKERKRQLNRESARRSRLRKQQECDELHKTVDTLVIENSLLKDKLMSLSEDCLELNNENNSIEEEVVKIYGIESIADLVAMKPDGVSH